jgi:hypothetical protein
MIGRSKTAGSLRQTCLRVIGNWFLLESKWPRRRSLSLRPYRMFPVYACISLARRPIVFPAQPPARNSTDRRCVPVAISSAFGNCQRDVVVLFMSAEPPDFIHNGRYDALRGQMPMAPQCVDQALFSEFFAFVVERFGYPIRMLAGPARSHLQRDCPWQ